MDDRTAPALQAQHLLVPVPRAAMLQFLSLLPLGATDVDAVVAEAVAANPVLERGPGWTCGTCGRFCVAARCPACSITTRPPDLTAPQDWREELRGLARLELPAALHGDLDLLVDSLDDRGFLPASYVDQLTTPETDAVLATVREVGPPGIAATSATDCVRLQVRRLIARGLAPPMLAVLVADWLPELAEERYDEIASALGTSGQAVRDAATLLRSATRPFVSMHSEAPRAGPVDVEFVAVAGQVVARVVDPADLGLRMVADFGDLDRQAREWLAPHRRAAEQLLAALNARSRMLQRVAEVLADRQRAFVLDARDHQPLRRAQVAAELGVHPSTVGRAVTAKVGRCPDGRVLPLVALFGVGASNLDHVAAVAAAIPGATDAALALELARRGTPLARRTVAKYRAMLEAAPKAPSRSA